MKKVSTTVIIILFVFSFLLGYLRLETKTTAVADWEFEMELSTDIGTETQTSPHVAVDNGKVHAVWTSYEDGDGDIYYSFSNDEGKTWELEQEISQDNATEYQHDSSIDAEGENVHVVWANYMNTSLSDSDIYYRHFDGLIWHPIQEISIDDFIDERQHDPEIAVEGDIVHVVWSTTPGESSPKPFDDDVIYRRFNGMVWESPIEIGTDVVPNTSQWRPDIAVENGRVHVVWTDNRDSEKDIYYRYFDGTSWQPEQEISIDPGAGTVIQSLPRIGAENGEVYVVWGEWLIGGSDENDVYYRHFNGTSWEPPMEVSVDFSGTEGQWRAAIAVENGKVYVIYEQHLANPIDTELYYRNFNGTAWQSPMEISTDKTTEYQQGSDIAVQNGIVHVVWQEGVWGDENDIYYRRFVPQIIDLQITNDDIVFNPDSPVVNGTYVNINATIHNIGPLMVGGINVSFYNGDPARGGTLIGLNQTIPFLMDGENATVNITWLPPSPGIYEIFVAVDYPTPGMIMEINETNNIASKTLEVTGILPPTLYIEAVGEDIILNWTQPCITGLSHYLLYRATSQTGFDFSNVWINTTQHDDNGTIPLRTTWNDTGAALGLAPSEYYYAIRTVSTSGDISFTSRTVGKWTTIYNQGVCTFSLPLEPLDTLFTDELTSAMNASYLRWMNTTTHTWMQHNIGDGSINNTQMKMGEGYEVKFSNQTTYTFTGMPGAIIMYDDDILFSGFDPDSEAKNLTVSVEPDGNVTLAWQEPASMGPGDWYEVYYSSARDGFFKTLGLDYDFACPSIGFGTNTTTISGLGANDPGARLYFMVVPFNFLGIRGASTYSIGVWTEDYLAEYDTFGIPLKMSVDNTAEWYCDNIPNTVGINYYLSSENRWVWHSTRMPAGAYDPVLVMTEGYQISTSSGTEFTFIGV